MEASLNPCEASAEASADLILWTLAQLLERLPVSRSTVYRWIEQEGLPVVRIGGSTKPFFLPQSVRAWLNSREHQKPGTPAQSSAAASNAASSDHLVELRRPVRRPRSRRTPPPPIATAGSRERLRRIHGAR